MMQAQTRQAAIIDRAEWAFWQAILVRAACMSAL